MNHLNTGVYLTNVRSMLTSYTAMSSFFFFFVFLPFLGPLPVAYGSSQARSLIGAVATGLRQGYSNAGSEPRLQPTPQLTATPDP